MKQFLYILIAFVSLNSIAQTNKNINTYKYVIVKDKFDFLKEADQYQTSSLTKFLFEKEGFIVFLANEKMPEELITNKCKALSVTVIDNSGMFSTKEIIELKDCYGTVIFTSDEGKSKSKQYRTAYHEAIREAFESIKKLNYSYQPIKKETIAKNDISVAIEKPIVEIPLAKKDVVKVVKETMVNNTVINEELTEEVLYAQAKQNGFQLVNTKPSVVFMILKTSKENIFIIKGKNGILYLKDAIWVAEYYQDNQIVKEKYQIKF